MLNAMVLALRYVALRGRLAGRGRMGYREFIDSIGTMWKAWNIVPPPPAR